MAGLPAVNQVGESDVGPELNEDVDPLVEEDTPIIAWIKGRPYRKFNSNTRRPQNRFMKRTGNYRSFPKKSTFTPVRWRGTIAQVVEDPQGNFYMLDDETAADASATEKENGVNNVHAIDPAELLEDEGVSSVGALPGYFLG